MSGGFDAIRERIDALQKAPEAAAVDVAAMLSARLRSGSADARGDTVALIPGGKRDAFLSDAWAADVSAQIAETTARIGGE